MCCVKRIEENKFYILYKRILSKNDISSKYVIYRTPEYGGDFFGEYRYKTEAKRIFVKLTKESLFQEKEIGL